ncbi:unnamed protein product [Medioppia subpectinata]|uniref:long-chain-fatty-acid--CoA ligase n=1 Tax=Medioppia subpectinata TaxID=1979941 RepID=A0A7R9Q5R0_9ACAR|nr:unnamed protein product [Medioppia subpectinata]CAG2113604.1 unnamed protein product [Medioppia subpectinata]
MSHQRKILVSVIILLVRVFVNVYTYVTLPYYYFKQKPWNRLKRANRCRSKLEDPNDSDSAWICDEPEITYPVIKPTVTETLNNLADYHGQQTPILAYREVLSAEESVGADGKARRIDGRSLRKYRLSDYKWLTYGEIDTITTAIAKGLAANGAAFGDKILILSETRVEWFLCAQAVAKLGASVVTLFSNLGDEGIVYGINQTEIKLMIVSCDLMPKIRSLITQIPTVETIVYIEHKNLHKDITTSQVNGFPDNIRLQSLQEVERTGTQMSDIEFQTPKPEDVFVIMYTSGTTGPPKAAIATHRQMVDGSANTALLALKDVISESRSHTYIAFLPLAHVFELTVEFALFYGIVISFLT